ncbi:SixA phosphatase family protein [Blastopirellula marina]|nr:histidine phosphatase family protein [Blastopirellula marina]
MRHAKSSWSGNLPDHERPLNGRGRTAAPLVAAELVRCGWTPDVVVASDARRTVETWERMRETFSPTPYIVIDPALYLSGYSELVSAGVQLSDTWQTALFLGHNPGWEMAASHFSGEPIEMKTGMAVLLKTEAADWKSAFQAQAWQLAAIIRPRDLA